MSNFQLNIDADLKRRLSDIDNQSCILVEFPNDESLGTGFTAWLSDENRENISTIIEDESEIEIFWPCCDIENAAKLKKKLKNIDFKKHVVRVLAYGEWLEMRKQMNNVMEFGKLNVSKKSRKQVKKKVVPKDENMKLLKRKKSVAKDKRDTIYKEKSIRLLADIEKEQNSEIEGSTSNKKKEKFSMILNEKNQMYSNSDSDQEDLPNVIKIKADHKSESEDDSEMPNKRTESFNDDEIREETDRNTKKRSFNPWQYSHVPLVAKPGMPELPLSNTIKKGLPKTEVRAFAAALAVNVFTKEELRNHSVTGIAPNSFPGMKVKPALPGRRMQYIFETVTEVFGRGKSIETQIRRGVQSKITGERNNARHNAKKVTHAD